MASGTVTYTARMSGAHQEIYNGRSAKRWSVTRSGDFPATPYNIVSASVSFDVRTAYASTRHMVVSRIDGSEVSDLGDVPTGQRGRHTESLSTSANYEGITVIQLDGVERWACQLWEDSDVIIEVQWEDAEPVDIEPEDKPISVVTGTIRGGGEPDTAMRTEPIVAFEGVNISAELKRYLLSLSYTDNEEDETDDLQIKLQDAEGMWLRKWLNASVQAAIGGEMVTLGAKTKGMQITAGIRCAYRGGVIRQTDCGSFSLDSIKASGPPSTVTIKATSLPYAAGVRTEERDKAWEEYTLSGIGAEIAGRAGLGFLFDAGNNPFYKRLEQAKETDISFLQRLCHDAGYSLKVSGSKLIIFDQARYEALEAVCTIKWMDGTYTKYDLSTTEGDVTYARCEVRYYDPDTKENIVGSATAETFDAEDENNQTLVITDHKVANAGEAGTLAAKLLRLHNKYEREVSFTLIGNPLLAAGLTIMIEGFGMWDGKYLIRQCKHDISASGYTTKIKARCVYAHQVEKGAKTEEQQTGSYSRQQTGEAYWALACTASFFSAPPGQAGSRNIGTCPGGTEVSILGTTSGSYTYVSGGGLSGYVSTGALVKKYR